MSKCCRIYRQGKLLKNEWQLVAIGELVDLSIAVACNSPQLVIAVVAIVDNTHTAIDVAADGRSSTSIAAQVFVILIHSVVTVIEQVGTNHVHVLVVVFAVMARATFVS